MQVILHFIRFGTNEALAQLVDGAVERVFIRHTKVAKGVTHLTVEPATERL